MFPFVHCKLLSVLEVYYREESAHGGDGFGLHERILQGRERFAVELFYKCFDPALFFSVEYNNNLEIDELASPTWLCMSWQAQGGFVGFAYGFVGFAYGFVGFACVELDICVIIHYQFILLGSKGFVTVFSSSVQFYEDLESTGCLLFSRAASNFGRFVTFFSKFSLLRINQRALNLLFKVSSHTLYVSSIVHLDRSRLRY
ncbi:hypothetical protein SUGI_0801660 [Cryptomeria japonica]|nr:hypothetical protein SUGI_0801660 [Cryptomeria japonica]